MPNNQTTIVFYADEPNYELARRVVKKIEGIDPLPFNKEELGSFFISDFNDWQNPDLNSAMSKQARKELESQMPCPNVSANEAADLLNHECYYVLHLKPHREDGNKIDLFSLNDAFLFWQYFEKRFSDNNATITDSRVTVLINLSDGHNKEDYTRISKYFRLAALYYGMTFYDSTRVFSEL